MGRKVKVSPSGPLANGLETQVLARGSGIVQRDRRKAYLDQIPLNRLGKAEDIARTARFLLSTDAAYITSAEIVVDDGVMRTTL